MNFTKLNVLRYTMNFKTIIALCSSAIFFVSCNKSEEVAKPLGQVRLEYPQQTYLSFKENVPYTFQYSNFGKVIAGLDIRVDAHADGVRYFRAGRERWLKFTCEPCFIRGLGEKRKDRVDVRTRHPIDVCSPLDEFLRERLRADGADIHTDLAAGLHTVFTRALAVASRDACAGYLDVAPRTHGMQVAQVIV